MSDDTWTAILVTAVICTVIMTISVAIVGGMAFASRYSPSETEMKYSLARDMLRGCAEKP